MPKKQALVTSLIDRPVVLADRFFHTDHPGQVDKDGYIANIRSAYFDSDGSVMYTVEVQSKGVGKLYELYPFAFTLR